MNYKIIISSLLLLSTTSCTELSKTFSSQPQVAWQTIEHFQVHDDLAIDTRTGLMWTRCLVGTNWNGITCTGKATSYGWQASQTLAKTLKYAGYDDWRVPTLDELKSLADKEVSAPMTKIPHLNQIVFPTPNCLGIISSVGSDGHSCWQWTSTPIEGSDHYAWIVYFGYGYGSANYEADNFALRLVRNNR